MRDGDGGGTLAAVVEGMAMTMDTEDKAALAEKLRRAVVEEMLARPDGGVPSCPRCSCHEVARWGHDRRDRQHWICKGCGQAFCPGSNTAGSRSHIDADTSASFAGCVVDRRTLGDSAEKCGGLPQDRLVHADARVRRDVPAPAPRSSAVPG